MIKSKVRKKINWTKIVQWIVDILTIGISHLVKYGKKNSKATDSLPSEESNTPT